MRRLASPLAGALLLSALAAALPAGLHFLARGPELSVTLDAPEPFEIAPGASAALAPAVPGPPELLPRLERNGAPDRDDPGLWLRTWQVTYGRRWERQVTVPVLAGPFDPEGKPWPCAVALRFSPRFFDDRRPGGEDVEAVVDRLVRAQFPFDVLGLRFARVARTQIAVRPEEGGLVIAGTVVLADAARDPTQLSFSARIVLGERDGELTTKADRVSLTWSGNTRHDPMVALASMFIDVDAQARAILAGRLSGALAFLGLPKDPIPLLDSRPQDRFTLRLCDAPESHPDGVIVRLRLTGTLAEPRVDPAVPGPPHLEARPDLAPSTTPQPSFEAAVSAAGIQQALYVLWQSGELEAWGKQPTVTAALRDKLQDRLAFELGAVRPRLPPVVLPDAPGASSPEALRIRFGDLELGAAGDRRVAAHGDFFAHARVENGLLGLSAELADLRVSCIAGGAGAWQLSPCFSDVVPVLRESGLTSAGLPLDLPFPDRLMRIDLVLGTSLVLRGLTGEVSGSPPALRVKGEARLVRR